MFITRRSMYSGVVRERDLPVTQEQVDQYEDGISIDVCMPHLSLEDRMFFIAGITDEDWDESTVSIGDRGDL